MESKNLLSIWLALLCIFIIIMIMMGGLVRLTGSGLSMTDWKPISGVMPPLNNQEWNIEFNEYKKYPEYLEHNNDMTLSEFKFIYWMEFTHRILARFLTIIFILPLIYFTLSGKIREIIPYILAGTLLSFQAIMGWYMVRSGLVSDPYVSHYRLSAHLIIAVFLYSIIFWQLVKSTNKISLTSNTRAVNILCIIIICLTFLQITIGGLVAGLKAGLIYNDFPTMGGDIIPYEIINGNISLNDPVFVQFLHRIIAYIIFFLTAILCYNANPLKKLISRIALTTLITQMLLGILTLMSQINIYLALAHQFFAICLLSSLIYFLLGK